MDDTTRGVGGDDSRGRREEPSREVLGRTVAIDGPPACPGSDGSGTDDNDIDDAGLGSGDRPAHA